MKLVLIIFMVFICVGCSANRLVNISGERGSQAIESQRYQSTGTEIEVIGEGRGFMPTQLVRVTLVKEEFVNGFLKLHLGFQSKSNKFRDMQYLVTFFGERGYPLEKFNVGWLPISVNPRSVTYQQVMAKTKEAKTYKIHVRKLKDTNIQ